MRLRHLLERMRDPGHDSTAAPVLRPDAPRGALAPLLFLVGALAVTGLVWSAADESVFDDLLASLSSSDLAQDEGAGDGLAPAAEPEQRATLAAMLDDERVAAALGPIAKLTCNKNDPKDDATASPVADPLSEPLAAAGADADNVAQEHLMAAAAAPIAMVAVGRDPPPAPTAACPALLSRTFNRLQTGRPESLCQFEGKVLLVVNTASYCGYTHQYEGLEALYRKYRDRGLVVIGFPSNDFGGQEPGTNQEIAQFCRLTYGVQFPMYEKSSVTDVKGNPLIAELAARTGKAPQWNFHKYVVDRSGQPVASFTSQVEPSDAKLTGLLERLLDDKAPAARPSPG